MSNYNPWMQFPYGMQSTQSRPVMPQYGVTSTPRQLIRVSGMEGAKAFQMFPNEDVPLFDNGDDIMFVKSTDGAGFPTIRRFRFFEEAETPQTAPQPQQEYVTRSEFEELKGWLMQNGKQSVQKPQPRQVRVPADGPDAE